jgi:two-component system, OmpR family, sensor histidine kinase BaeS
MNTPENTLKKTGPGPLRRGLDTLRVKLFLAIAGAHLVLVAAVYLIYSWSFDTGLVEYVKRSEQDRLSPVIQQLADGYSKNGDWMWLTENREQWWGLLQEVLGWRAGRPAQANAANPASGATKAATPATGAPGSQATETKASEKPTVTRPEQTNVPRTERPRGDRGWNFQPGTELPLTIDFFRLMLFDANGKVLILNRDARQDADNAEKLPIRVDGRLVGYLGYIPRLQQVESLESITRKQQSNRIQVIGVGMFVTVLIIAAMIAHWLTLRLGVLGAGATALARGDYATRIPVQGHDELARLAGDFNRLAEALGAAQRGRQQWIADIAHELRTPLTALRAEIEAVQDGVRPLTQASIASVAHEVHRLARLVEDLRLLSLSDLGALTTRKEPLELDEAIADALALGRAAIEQKPLGVELRLAPRIVIDADPDRMSQVFSNLLQNTLRYTEPPAFLHIGLTVEGREARIDWEDSSPGVGDADLPHLTERLYRVDASRSSASGGSGLGLAIVQAIVQAHGGRMQAAHSALGGLHWRIWLPLSDHRPA